MFVNNGIFEFRKHDVVVKGEEHHLIELVKMLRSADVEGTWADLIYQIEYFFNVDSLAEVE